MKEKAQKQSHIVGLKELRNNIGSYISQIEKGNSFTVVRRSKPIFRISPFDEDEDSNWEVIADFTAIQKKGIPAEKVLSRLKAYGRQN